MSARRHRRPFRRTSEGALRDAEREAALAREHLAGAGFAASIAPDVDREAQAVSHSRMAVSRLRVDDDAGRRASHAPIRPAVLRGTGMAAVAAGVAAVVVAISFFLPGGARPATAGSPPLLVFSKASTTDEVSGLSSAHDALLALAGRAAQQAVIDPAGGYVLTSAEWALAFDADAADPQSAVIPFRSTLSVSPDGAAQRMQQRGEPLTPDGRGVASSVTALAGPETQVDKLPPGSVDVGLPAALPRDATALRQALLAQRGCAEEASSPDAALGSYGATCLVRAMMDLYDAQLVPPDLQAALWRMLAGEPSMKSAGSGEDRAGRACEAFVVEANTSERSERWVIMVDLSTGDYLGLDHVLTRGRIAGLAAPLVLDFRTELNAQAL